MSFSYYGELCTGSLVTSPRKSGQSFGGDIEYYRERLKPCKGRILEAMVGSGRVLIRFWNLGLIVDGVDYSPEMLASCRQRCQERTLAANLYESNLQELSLPDKYEAILIPGGSFLLIEKKRRVRLTPYDAFTTILSRVDVYCLIYSCLTLTSSAVRSAEHRRFALPDGDRHHNGKQAYRSGFIQSIQSFVTQIRKMA